jgi:hypothetical protein
LFVPPRWKARDFANGWRNVRNELSQKKMVEDFEGIAVILTSSTTKVLNLPSRLNAVSGTALKTNDLHAPTRRMPLPWKFGRAFQ